MGPSGSVHAIDGSQKFITYLNQQIVAAGFHGDSYNVGEQIPNLLVNAGLQLTQIHPICRIARPHSRYWQWVSLFHQTHPFKLVEQGLITEAQRLAAAKDWSDAAQDPATFFFTPPMLGIIATKPG